MAWRHNPLRLDTLRTMLRPLLVLTVLLVPVGVASAQTDRDRDGLLGVVRTVVVEKTILPPRRWQEAQSQPGIMIGDMHVRSIRAAGNIAVPVPPLGRLQAGGVSPLLSRTLHYDRQGKRTEAAFYTADGSLRWRWRYTYDSEGNRTERHSYTSDASLRWRWRYTYDAAGRLTAKAEYASDGTLARHWHYTYDTKGRMIRESNLRPDGTLLGRWSYRYDAQGRRIEKAEEDADGTRLWAWRSTYDARGNLVERAHYTANGTMRWKRRYTHDTRGNVTTERRYNSDGTLGWMWRYTYAYDAVGNWTRRTKMTHSVAPGTSDFAPSEITYRTLLYD